MSPFITFLAVAAVAFALCASGRQVAAKGRPRTGKVMVNIGSLVVVVAAIIFYHNDRSKTAQHLKATLEILEQRIQQDDKQAALEIVDRSIRFFGSRISAETTGNALEFAQKVAERKSKSASSTPVISALPSTHETHLP